VTPIAQDGPLAIAELMRTQGRIEEAIAEYERQAASLAAEEAGYALYQAGKLSIESGRSASEISDRLLRAFERLPHNAEPLGELARHLRIAGQRWPLAFLFADMGLRVGTPTDGKFLDRSWYDWRLLDEFAIAAFWLGKFAECEDACDKLLASGKLPDDQVTRVAGNRDFAQKRQGKHPGNLPAVLPPATTPTLQHTYDGCPLCGNDSASVIGDHSCEGHPLWKPPLPRTLRWQRCDACAHVYTTGFWTDEALRVIFSNSNDYQLPGAVTDQQRFLWAPVVQTVIGLRGGMKQMRDTQSRWLDVGFGNGSLLLTAQELGFLAEGLDARALAVEKLGSLGMVARAGSLADLDADSLYDVISLCDVLEHVAYPIPAVSRVARALRAGGMCLVSCPDIESSSWKSTDRAGTNGYWGELEHHHNFSAHSLRALFANAGMELVHRDVSNRYKSSMQLIFEKPRAR
jgi:SAM-dependent methyltransferase